TLAAIIRHASNATVGGLWLPVAVRIHFEHRIHLRNEVRLKQCSLVDDLRIASSVQDLKFKVLNLREGRVSLLKILRCTRQLIASYSNRLPRRYCRPLQPSVVESFHHR